MLQKRYTKRQFRMFRNINCGCFSCFEAGNVGSFRSLVYEYTNYWDVGITDYYTKHH